MNRQLIILLALPLLFLALVPGVQAQEAEAPLELRLRRDFGYGSGLRVQGRFSMHVAEFEDVERVEFLIDDEVIGEDGEAPFSLRFQTGDYPDGWHTMRAVGYRPNGETVPSNSIRREFVPASTATWTVVAVFGVVIAGLVLRYVLTRGDKATSYGMVGGTVCPHCDRPFAYHIWSFALLVGRLDRCPHCGKWSFTRRWSPQDLAAVEAELNRGDGQGPPEMSDEERLRRQLDSSRYEDV
jgi:hypothetical protein